MNFFNTSFIIQYMTNNGVPRETIILLLMLPIVATIIALARQIIGIKGFGIYTPLIISFAFLATGLKYGLAFFIAILLAGTVARFLAKRFRLLYLPRMALVLTAVAIAIIFLLGIGAFYQKKGLIAASIFAILIMITMVEKFVSAQIERGTAKAIILTVETLILSIICYWAISWSWLQGIVILYPLWVIVSTGIINVFLGKWTGLRLSEYFRFRDVIKNVELPKKK